MPLSDGPIPIYASIRRVPERYHRLLPLALMKRYQCVVIGSEQGCLTIAVTRTEQKRIIQVLRGYTRKPIVTVLVEPARMRLLISRIERCQKDKRKRMKTYHGRLLEMQVCAILHFCLPI